MSQHAPRGRIKARPDVNPLTLNDPLKPKSVRCRATSKRTGLQCGAFVTNGAAVCKWHGGKAPQVMAAAQRRLDELRPAAIQYYDYLLGQREYPSAGLGAANAVMDRVDGRPAEKVQLEVTASASLIERIQARRIALSAKDK